jgi:hypothetical protein
MFTASLVAVDFRGSIREVRSAVCLLDLLHQASAHRSEMLLKQRHLFIREIAKRRCTSLEDALRTADA